MVNCDGRCVDTQTDFRNCGACGSSCGEGYQCAGGQCVFGECYQLCWDGSVCCSSPWGGPQPGCTDLNWDNRNCGACDDTCGDAGWCSEGQCECWVVEGWTELCDGVCTSLRTADNCGQCGNACTDDAPVCEDGNCVDCSDDGRTDCGGWCADLQNDSWNCGACGAYCEGACVAGECTPG